MAFLVALLLALFVLPYPWNWVAVGLGAAIELGEAWFWWWLSAPARTVGRGRDARRRQGGRGRAVRSLRAGCGSRRDLAGALRGPGLAAGEEAARPAPSRGLTLVVEKWELPGDG